MKELERLFKLTKESKSPVVQDFRKEVMRFVNEQEAYISELEMQNMLLFKKIEYYSRMQTALKNAEAHETIMRDLIVKAYIDAQ